MRNATPELHYATYVDGDESRACVDVAKLIDALPHGSGIDGNWYVTVKSNGTVELSAEYHMMNENGFYCGWRTMRATLRKLTAPKRHELSTPGYWQELHPAGAIVLTVANRGELGDMFHEILDFELGDIVSRQLSPAVVYGPNGRRAEFSRETGEWVELAEVSR